MENNLLDQALQASAQGNLEEWIHSFLHASGRNIALSDGLKKAERFWIGPVEVSLGLLHRIQGPADDATEHEIEEKWLKRVTPMIADLQAGWKPAPLIAEYADGKLMIRDGGHRLYSLKKSGHLKYWTIIWVNTKEDYVKAKEILSA